jgi:hypothetical protein
MRLLLGVAWTLVGIIQMPIPIGREHFCASGAQLIPFSLHACRDAGNIWNELGAKAKRIACASFLFFKAIALPAQGRGHGESREKRHCNNQLYFCKCHSHAMQDALIRLPHFYPSPEPDRKQRATSGFRTAAQRLLYGFLIEFNFISRRKNGKSDKSAIEF